MNSADSCSPPHTWLIPADSSCKTHQCFVQCKDFFFFLCLHLRTKPGLNCGIFPLPALCRSIIHRRAAPPAACSPQAACWVSLLCLQCWISHPHTGLEWPGVLHKITCGFTDTIKQAMPLCPSLFKPPYLLYTPPFIMHLSLIGALKKKKIAIMVVSFLWFKRILLKP